MMGPSKNPCIKTGATVVLPHDRWWYGDLFDLGDYYYLHCPEPQQFTRPPPLAHLQVESWYLDHENGLVVVFHKSHADWFDYNGKPTS